MLGLARMVGGRVKVVVTSRLTANAAAGASRVALTSTCAIHALIGQGTRAASGSIELNEAAPSR